MLTSQPSPRPPPSSRPPPPPSVTSDPRRVAMETYWREVQSIEEEEEEEDEEEGEEEEEEEDDDDGRSLDEAELEEKWLTEAGLSSLVSGGAGPASEGAGPASGGAEPASGGAEPASGGAEPAAEALLSTLTRQQAATVRRRLLNYSLTLRRSSSSSSSSSRQPITDVRHVFTQVDDDDLTDRSSASSPNGPSPSLIGPSPSSNGPSPSQNGPSPSQNGPSPSLKGPSPSPNGSAPFPNSSPIRYHISTKTIRRHRVRPSVPSCLFNHGLLEDAPPPDLSPAPPAPVTQSRRCDWLLRDSPYSEGVAQQEEGGAEPKEGGACDDHDDDSDAPFVPVSPSQGVVSADDLSPCDLTQLRFISHIELSTLLLALGVQIKHTRPPPPRRRSRSRDSGVFGVPLNFLLERDRKKFPGVKVPIVFQKLLCILERSVETEGILRVPGSAARLKYLRGELDRCGGDMDWSSVRQVEAAGLLKLFIRELPTPLLTHTHLNTYHAVLGVSSLLHQVQVLHLLTLLLPEVNRETLRALLVFLRDVVSHQDQNRMSLWNVSMVMAPNLFSRRRHGNKPSVARQQEELEEAVGGARLVRLLVAHQDLMWTVPRFLLSQVRRMNQATNQRLWGLGRLLRRRDDRNQVTELCDGVIVVHAPRHTKVSTAIRLQPQTRARDVTARFQCDNGPAQCLYEVGGNICERRLHPDCFLLDVYRVNPHCDWLIKP